MNQEPAGPTHWWATLPGILTTAAIFLILLGSLMLVFNSTGVNTPEKNKFMPGTALPQGKKVEHQPCTELKKYHGNRGNDPVFCQLFWLEGHTISGSCFINYDTNTVYTVSGRLFDDGHLLLNEFCNGEPTAQIILQPNMDCYSGKMDNNDGSFSPFEICPL